MEYHRALFLNPCSDLFLIKKELEISNFADDTAMYACDTSIEVFMTRLEISLDMMLQWLHKVSNNVFGTKRHGFTMP